MNIIKNTKILIGILVIIIIAIGGYFIFKNEQIEKPIEVKGKLETAKPPSIFNKECLDSDLKLGNYYLSGICKKPYLAASLLEIIGEEIEIKGVAKEIKTTVPSEENPEILITKTFEVIEVEEIAPPEIIRIITNTTVYESGEKITIHLKHYLRKSVFSYFNTEKPICAIKSIEKKDGDWVKLSPLAQATDCPQITLKEIRPYHLSGEFGVFEWQPNLDSGEYRLKIVYRFEGEEDWKEIYSNEFVILTPEILKPGIETKCKVERGWGYFQEEAERKFYKIIIAKIGWINYEKFFLKEMIIRYGYGPNYFEEDLYEEGLPTTKLILKIKSKDQKILVAFKISDPRRPVILWEWCPDCPPPPPPEFLKEGETTLIFPVGSIIPIGRRFIDLTMTRFIELFDATKEDPMFPDYKPTGQLLLSINSECLKKFCDEVALENDPLCIGEYYSPTTIIKGKITDQKGNPVERAMINIQWAPFGEPLTYKSKIVDTLYTDKDGNYILERFQRGQIDETRLKEGTYSLSITPSSWRTPNLKSEYKEITLKKGETKIVNVALKECGSVAGKITDKEGNPLTEASVYEIGFETPRYAVCEEARMKEGICELGAFVIPCLEPGDYRIGAEVKVGEEWIELSLKEVKVELGKTAIVNFVLEK